MNNLQLTIAELKVEYAEQRLSDVTERSHESMGYQIEEDLFDRLIENMQTYEVDHNSNFIKTTLSKAQRQRFFDRVALVMAYEMDGMREREFMLNIKLKIYEI
jgi:hypothetical protein